MNSFSIKQALSFALSTIKTRSGLLFLLLIISAIIPTVAFLVPILTMILPVGLMSGLVQATIPVQAFQAISSPLLAILAICIIIIGILLWVSGMLWITDMLLHLHQGTPGARTQLHHLRTLIVPALLATSLYRAAEAILFLLLIIPGIIWIVCAGLYWYALVDEHTGPIASIKESMRLTRGNRLKLLLFYALFTLASGIVGALLHNLPLHQASVPSRMLDIVSALISGIINGIMILAEIDIYYQLKHRYALIKKDQR